jgi:16S rRNA (cytosine967-C5)-methyltransferase
MTPPRGRSRVDLPRLTAYDVLVGVRTEDAYANLLLGRLLAERGLTGRDAAFTTELVSGTLRWQGTYDAVIDHLAGRPPDPAVRDALRLGAHQLLSMRVPDHAAVASTVELVRERVGHKPAGFVNAVLRRMTARSLEGWMDALGAPLHVRWSHPAWVVAALEQALGGRGSELPDLLAAQNAPPRVAVVARPGLCERDELLRDGAEPTPWSPYGVVLAEGAPADLPAVAEGRAGVQDEGSQLVALALAEAAVDGADRRWLDLCAGPGGKAALLGGLASRTGARLLAVERQPHRAELVRRTTRALPVGTVDIVAADGTGPAWEQAGFDRVLVDAPCTGLGALRRRPEARWRRTPDDLPGLVSLQRRLLGSALDAVRPGGVVAYATCSPLLEETGGVVTATLEERSDVSVVPVRGPLAGVPDSDGPVPGTVQLWPHRHGTDAMFLALLQRAV